MKNLTVSASLGILGLALLTGPAVSGDWNHGAGSLKDRGHAAVPVPAPYPVYDGPSGWYMRADIGLARQTDVSASERGVVYGAGNGVDASSPTGAGFGSSPSWFSKDFDTSITYGIGVGYHWTPNWRSDLTIERRGNSEYKMRGNYTYQQHLANVAAPPAYGPGPTTIRIDGTSSDATSIKSGVFMANTYYDWKNTSAFTPYIGGGIGFAYLELDRDHVTTETECDTAVFGACNAPTARAGFTSNSSVTRLAFAGALSAGFSYAVTSVTSVDVNYRFLYIPGSNIDTTINGNQSRLSFADITEHQLRAGLRWDIN